MLKMKNGKMMKLNYLLYIVLLLIKKSFGEGTLKSREDITKWQIIKYKSCNLIKGQHTITIKTSSNNKIGSPNIDYIDFKTKEIGK